MSSFLKDVLSVGMSKFVIIGFSLATGIITARWLGPEGNGTIAALTVYPSLFLTFGALGVSQSTTHLIGHSRYSENDIKKSIAQIWVFSTVFSLLSSFFLIKYFSNSGENLTWAILAILPIPFTLFNKYNSGIFLGKNQISAYNRINWIPKVLGFFAIVILLVFLDLGISAVLLAAIIGPLFIFIFLLFMNGFIDFFSTEINFKLIKNIIYLGLIYALALLIINLNYKVDIILLDKLSTSFNTGIYSKGVAIADYLWEIPMLLSTTVFARSASAKNDMEFSIKVTRLLRISIVVIGIAALILIFVSKYIILIMYGQEFIKSTEVIQLLLPGVLLLTFFKVLNMDLAGKGKPWVSMKAMVPAVIINIILNLLIIPKYGANGAAFSSTFSYTIAALLFLYFYSKEVGIPIAKILAYSKRDLDFFKSILQKMKKS